MAAVSNPVIRTRRTPKRATRADPGVAASAKTITGMPVSTPIAVPERCRSAWITDMTGGTASTVSRRQAPQVHNRSNDLVEVRTLAMVSVDTHYAVHNEEYSCITHLNVRGRLQLLLFRGTM